MKLIFDDFPADLFNLIMHGEFYRATEKDYTRLMRIFNSCVIVKQEPKPEATPYEPKGDLISREALKEAVKKRFDNSEYFPFHFLALIDNAQAVDLWQMRQEATENALKKAEVLYDRPKGEWKLHGMIYYCSECGHDCGESGDNFCGNCGADMRKGGAE